jgi:hypothetical protein
MQRPPRAKKVSKDEVEEVADEGSRKTVGRIYSYIPAVL